jgi:hypothetical protein
VAILPLFYGRHEIVAECLRALEQTRHDADAEVFAIENPSAGSERNRALLREAMGRGEVSGLYLSDANAVFNTLLCVLAEDVFGLRGRFDYIVLSDGDVAPGAPFLAEHIRLLGEHPRMSSVALRIDVAQWHRHDPVFPAAMLYGATVLKAERDGRDYAEYGGGLWMRMFRAEQLFRLVEDFVRNGFRLRDGQIDRYFQMHGMFPAVSLKSRGVELPHGPMYLQGDGRKREAHNSMAGSEGFLNIWNHDAVPAGSIETRTGAQAHEARPLAPASSPEEHAGLGDAPAISPELLSRHPTAQVVDTLDWDDPGAGLRLVLDRQFGRVLVGPEGGSIAAPLNVIERGPATPFLRSIRWDLGGEGPGHGVKMLGRVLAAASRLLTADGEVILEAMDVAAVARDLAAAAGRAEAAVRRRGRKLLSRAAEAAELSRRLSGRRCLFDAGEIVQMAHARGFAVVAVERRRGDDARLVYTLRRRAAGDDPAAVR